MVRLVVLAVAVLLATYLAVVSWTPWIVIAVAGWVAVAVETARVVRSRKVRPR